MNILDRQSQIQALERIETLGQVERWRAIRTLMWNLNPALRDDDRIHQEDVAARRREDGMKSTGASKSGSMRVLVSLPEYLYIAIKAADQEFMPMSQSKNKAEIRKLQRRLWTAFPEYRLAERF